MKVRIKRFDKSVPLPKYHTEGAACFDLAARETVRIMPGEIGYVPLNIAVETPKDHFLLLAARSSMHKRGLMLANGVGIGDSDFVGDDDEYRAVCLNFTEGPVVVEKGDRIAQGMFVSIKKADWEEVDALGNKTRGGLGSTGRK